MGLLIVDKLALNYVPKLTQITYNCWSLDVVAFLSTRRVAFQAASLHIRSTFIELDEWFYFVRWVN